MVNKNTKSAPKRAVVIGASGFIGSALVDELLQQNWQITAVGRSSMIPNNATEHVVADICQPLEEAIFNGADTVINLAGEPIYGYWSASKKRRMYDSRVIGTRNVVDALLKATPAPRLLINASAVGYYGDREEEVIDEHTPHGDDFLSRLCFDWEREARRASTAGMRVVVVRNGVVLGGGGLIKTLQPFFKAGLGIWLDSGQQWVPWIFIDDLVRLYVGVMNNDKPQNVINAVAASNRGKDFFKAYGKSLHRPVLFGLPHQLLWPRYGGMAAAVAVSQQITPSETVAAKLALTDLQKAFENI